MRLLAQLLARWYAQLVHLHEQGDDVDPSELWLWRVRTRILRYLVSRYSAAPTIAPSAGVLAATRAVPHVLREYQPQTGQLRSAENIAAVLWAVHLANQEGIVADPEQLALTWSEALTCLLPGTTAQARPQVDLVEVRPRGRQTLSRMLRGISETNTNAWKKRRWRWGI